MPILSLLGAQELRALRLKFARGSSERESINKELQRLYNSRHNTSMGELEMID